MPANLLAARLVNQQLMKPRFATAGALVAWMGAIQAQDYAAGLWAMGARLDGAREPDLERAIESRQIVRTWPMRRTLHFVPAEDVGWMLDLLRPRLFSSAAARYRAFELDEQAFRRSRAIVSRALAGGRRLTRAELYAALARGGVAPDGQRGIHVLAHLAQQGFVCFGPRRDRQPTFVLLDEWIPSRRTLPPEEALATLAARYFASHGPATDRDFSWWAGISLTDARRGIEAAGPGLDVSKAVDTGGGRSRRRHGATRMQPPGAARRAVLLPPWDEYLVAYRDRTAPLDGFRFVAYGPIGQPVVLINGLVRGTWRRLLAPDRVRIEARLQGRPSAVERQALEAAADAYGRYLTRRADLKLIS